MHELCVIGAVTRDRNFRDGRLIHSGPGGVAFYASLAASAVGVDVGVLTQLAPTDHDLLGELTRHGIRVHCFNSPATLVYENATDSHDPNARRQRILSETSPYHFEMLKSVSARFFHVGPLTPREFSVDFLRALKETGAIVALDAQGFLRQRDGDRVVLADWPEKAYGLAGVDILKADVVEATILTGVADPHYAIRVLAEYGPREVIITRGEQGALVYADERLYDIPAFLPEEVVDTTGCGDTYMGAYLAKRLQSDNAQEAAEYASEIAGLKAQHPGPFLSFADSHS